MARCGRPGPLIIGNLSLVALTGGVPEPLPASSRREDGTPKGAHGDLSVQRVAHPSRPCHLPRPPDGADDRSDIGRGAPGGLRQRRPGVDVDLPLAGKDLSRFGSTCPPKDTSLLFSYARPSRATTASVFRSGDCRAPRRSRLSHVSGLGGRIHRLSFRCLASGPFSRSLPPLS